MLAAQPAGYYSGTDGKFGNSLKSQLHYIIRNHVRFPYSSSSTDTWDILKQSDKDTTNPANVILIYTGWTLDGEAEYNNGNGWNREHVWPNSHGFPNSGDTAYTDVHHLRPSNIAVNGARGNKDFDNGGNQYFTGGQPTNCFTDGDSWEPRPEVKGDIARMVMYMASRYEGFSGYDLELVDYTGTPSQPILGKQSTLLAWNRQDPPDDYERNRNEVIYSYQHNRNPFVDHPEFADRIYNSGNFIINYAVHAAGNIIEVYFNQDINPFSAVNKDAYTLDRGAGHPYYVEVGYQDNYKLVRLYYNNLVPTTKYNLQITGITSSSNETIAENSVVAVTTDDVVPVELTSFTATFVNGTVILNWSTATETNNRGFEIEKNIENKGWNRVGFVDGKGNSAEITEYTYSDYFEGTSAGYRLKQVDYDGSFEYSDVVEVTAIPEKYALSQNYPNPFNPVTTIEFELPEANNVSITVYDVLGNKVAEMVNSYYGAGKHSVKYNASAFNSGVYFYEMNAGSFKTIRKMIVLK